ncbi:diadenylate cyclase [bacterium]|nr:diadenylate cyclase [bacterium]
MKLIQEQLRFLVERLLHDPQHIFEILILAVIVYYSFLFIRGTRALALLRGAVFLGVLGGVASIFGLDTINLLYSKFGQSIVLALIILFAPELRRALTEIGRQTLFKGIIAARPMAEPLCEAVRIMASRQTGALIAIERSVGLRGYSLTGVILDAEVTTPALLNIFFPKAPLHDGGVIIENGRIHAAACVFPLSSSPLSQLMGTRHRAALGLSEETDALLICVSEETGKISLFENGKWFQGVSVGELDQRLK